MDTNTVTAAPTRQLQAAQNAHEQALLGLAHAVAQLLDTARPDGPSRSDVADWLLELGLDDVAGGPELLDRIDPDDSTTG